MTRRPPRPPLFPYTPLFRSLVEGFLAGGDDAARDLRRHRAGERDEDVDHRDLDLGLLLARRDEKRECAEKERRDDEEGRELGFEERLRDPARSAERPARHLAPEVFACARRAEGVLAHRALPFASATGAPSAGGAVRPTRTVSPPERPERISILPPCEAPVVTTRVRAFPASSFRATRLTPPLARTALSGTRTEDRTAASRVARPARPVAAGARANSR